MSTMGTLRFLFAGDQHSLPPAVQLPRNSLNFALGNSRMGDMGVKGELNVNCNFGEN